MNLNEAYGIRRPQWGIETWICETSAKLLKNGIGINGGEA